MDSDYGVPRELSDVQKTRAQYQPELPPCLQGQTVKVEFGDRTGAADPASSSVIARSFPHTYGQPLAHFLKATAKVPDAQAITERPVIKQVLKNSFHTPSLIPFNYLHIVWHQCCRVGIVFCGRQSPGGHNVVWGLYSAIKFHNPNSTLLGFVGGFDMLGRTKDQIRTTEQVNAALTACQNLKLDGLVIIGGVTSNTDAAQLAETFAGAKCQTKVVGVPVSLNGDLKNQFVETNVGFDTICKVNSQLISNVCTDALSAEKVILGEEVAASKRTLFDITKQICDAVQARAAQDKYHGVVLLPEGLVESIPELYALLQVLHWKFIVCTSKVFLLIRYHPSFHHGLLLFSNFFLLSSGNRGSLSLSLSQLLLLPESDNSAQLSQIEMEKLLAELVETEINKRLKEGIYTGKKFNAICHFFGYQARGSLPSKFDCDYAYVLGYICYHILAAGLNGYMATVTNLKEPVDKWRCGAAPITAMMTVKGWSPVPKASSIAKPALHPAPVDLNGKAYGLLRKNASKLLMDDIYRNPGPLQFEGLGSDSKTMTLCAEDQDYMGRIKEFQEYLDKVKSIVKPGCSQDVLKAALSAMTSVMDVLSIMSSPSFNGQTSI
ncbi:hypothetical protein Taro_001938 [Colocasia esculenta]|uniref:Phosphofructokinase domain-containing protein n=1 Tax=Colocasia esculenta TaxID=4460 RepID=A0A843THB4_COLES|nr:hypothetical protein [Colocasia esculenta]